MSRREEGAPRGISLGIKANLNQFVLLTVVNALVGALVGFYSLMPLIGQREFGITSNTFILTYVLSFGMAKAVCNYYAGNITDRFGRKKPLILGWLLGTPVPIIVILAPNWWWIIFANILLGMNQGFSWSMTLMMKLDLAGPRRRGLATGMNEFAGYVAISVTLLVSGAVAAAYSLRPEPFYLGVGFTVVGLVLSLLALRETSRHSRLEAEQLKSEEKNPQKDSKEVLKPKSVFLHTTIGDRALSSCCLAGLVNNLVFGMSWGLIPLFLASKGLDVDGINTIKSFYPGVWGLLQLATGPLSDRVGRKWFVVTGQLIQSSGIWITVTTEGFGNWVLGSGLLGLGSALVYPTLIAAVSDVAHPSWRGASLGTYRFWRDSGYAVGAIFSGIMADLFGIPFAIGTVGLITMASSLVVAARMYETKKALEGRQEK